MKIIQITSKKVDEMSSLVEDMLLTGGELMGCLRKLSSEMHEDKDDYYNERRSRYSNDYGKKSDMKNDNHEKIEELLEELLEKKGRR